jgi:hypothetical protein
VQNLKVVYKRIYIGRKDSAIFGPLYFLANVSPKWWERLFYVSNVEVKLKKTLAHECPGASGAAVQ